MNKIIVFMTALLILFTGFATSSYALSDSQSDSIQTLLDDASRISGVPGMSISILANNEVLYFSSGYADREKGMPASESTLYELASVSKAFTGTGILLMEEYFADCYDCPVYYVLCIRLVNDTYLANI